MGKLVALLSSHHVATKRDYASRATDDKPHNSGLAKQFDFDYWDGDRKTGYGGYQDDGRWESVASRFLSQYEIPQNGTVLDVGCGKGYFLKEIKKIRPDVQVRGQDISNYALSLAPPEIKEYLFFGSADRNIFDSCSFDLVVAMNVLHNLSLPELFRSLEMIESSKKNNSYICVESYRNEKEKWNLMRWQLTCECFFTPDEWTWIFQKAGYTGDYEFIFFE